MSSELYVSCLSGCANGDYCGIGIDWYEDDFQEEFGTVPTTLGEASALVGRWPCDACGGPHQVEYLTVERDGEKLVDYSF